MKCFKSIEEAYPSAGAVYRWGKCVGGTELGLYWCDTVGYFVEVTGEWVDLLGVRVCVFLAEFPTKVNLTIWEIDDLTYLGKI